MKTPLSLQRALLLICMMAFGLNGWAQTAIPNTTSVTQNFDGMAATTALPSNWRMHASTASPTWTGASTSVTQQASSGTPATGGTYNWGTSASERAAGAMSSGGFASPSSLIGWYSNTNASNLTAVTVSYDLERYRINSAAASVTFHYSTDGTTWTAVTAGDIAAASLPTGANAYSFTPSGTPSTSNAGVINKTGIVITGLNIANGGNLYLRWNLATTGGNSQGIGVDNVVVTAAFAPSAITSFQDGPWTTAATWVGGVVPTSADNVIIAHNVTAGALTRNSGTTTTINTGARLAVSGTYTNTGSTTTVNGTFQLDAGGWATGSNFTYGAAGTLNFNNTASYGVNSGDVFWPTTSGPFNVNVLQGGVTLNSGTARTVNGTFATASGVSRGGTDALTLNGTVQINAGGFFNFAPTYGSSSTLIYNTGGSYGTSNEWTAGASNTVAAGSGIPANVSITNSTNVTLAGGRGTPGNVTVNAGATLTLNASAGDLYVGGNFTQNGSLINNSRAVFFVLGNAQTISSTNGGVFFDYFVVDKTAGSVQLSNSTPTNVTINSTSGTGLQLLNTVGLDLNGRSLVMHNSGGGIQVTGGIRNITSSLAGGSLVMNSNKAVSGTGTLVTDANVSWFLNNAGMDFGSSLTTINGTLQINSGGFVNTNPPTYGNASTLIYNSGGAYGAGTEWRTNAATGVGIPQNVQIGNGAANSSLNFGSSNQYRQANGNVTITNNTGANFTLSSAVGGDLRVVGNFVNNGTFTPNSRQVTFNGGAAQTITGTTTFDFLRINNTSSAVTLNSPIIINNQLDLSSGRLTLGSNNATLAAGASTINSSTASFVQINGTGNLVRNSVGASATLFPVGLGSTRYTPITLNNSGTVNDIAVGVGASITNAVADASRVVTVEWVVSPAGTGANVVATIDWVTTTNQNVSFNNAGTGELGVYTTGPNYAITNLGTLSGTSISTPAIALAAGVNRLVVGNTNAIVAPLLFAGSSSLTFSSVSGLASASQNFTISGVNLLPTSGNITVIGTTNYEVSSDNVTFGPSVTYAYTGGTFSATPTYVRLKASVIGTYNNETVTIAGGSAITLSVTCSGSVSASQASDIVTVAGSEAATVSSLLNSNISTVADGTQVWQFDIRDGGGSNDADDLPSVVTALTFAQSGGNEVNNWLDAIQSIQLFDGTTLVPATVNITNSQVQFTGLNISVVDNTTKRISVRLTLQTAFDNVAPGANQDGEDFGFSLSSANATFATTGSGKPATFAAAVSTNGQNVIEVIATQLSFSAQPSNVGVSATMSPAVAVTGADINGNPDKNGAYVVSITSGGTLTGAPVTVTTVNGTATFSGLVHSVTATNVSLTAAASGVTSAVSNGFDIVPVTTLAPGDAMIVGLNNLETGCSGAGVDIVHVLFLKDILVGTNIDFTDNAYTSATGPFASNEGVYRFTKTGSMLPAGTVVSFSIDGTSSSASGFSFTSLVANLAVATNDQVFLLFGGNPISNVYTGGTIVSGITSNGWLTTGSTTSNTSYLPAAISCASTAVTTTGQNFYKYNGSVFAAPIFEWNTRISNTSNWIRPSSCTNFSATTTGSYIVGSMYSVTSPTVTATDFCTGNSSTAVISGYTTVNTFTWTAPAGITATGTGATATLTSNAAGTYVVSVTPTNGACNGPQNTVTVTVSPNPTPTASNNGPMCEGGSLSVSVTSASSYVWSGPSSFSASTANPLVASNASAVNSGTYIVTVTSVNGCTATTSTVAIVNANPTPTISGPTATCTGTTVTYDAGAYTSYVWNVGNATQTNDYSTAGTYTVTVTDANSCTGSASKTLAFNANPTVTLSGTNPDCGTVILTASGANNYAWSTGGNTATENFTNGGTTSFSVTGTDSNGCTATFAGAATVNNSSYNVALATSGDNGQVLLQSCEEGPWTYYADPDNGKYYFAIKWDPNNIGSGHNMVQKGNAQVKTFVNSSLYGVTAAATTGTSAQPPKGTWVMSRGWNVTNAGTLDGNVDVRFFYDAAELSAIETAASNFVAANPTSNLEPLTWFKTVGTDYDPTEVANGNRINAEGVYRGASLILTPVFGSINGIDYAEFNTASFSGGGVASGAGANGNPLPIKLEYFRGEKNGELSDLTWRTQTETNNSHFIVERSLDGRDFRSVGQMQGAGNSASPINYAFTDENPVPGNNYYRLRQVDFNGASEFSNVVVLNFEKPFAVNAYPNPFNSIFTVDVYTTEEAEGKLEVFDISGRLLDVRNLNLGVGMNRKEVDASLLTPGAYLIKVTAGSNVTQRTMVKTQF